MLYAVFAREGTGWTFRKAFENRSHAQEFIRVSEWMYPLGMEIRRFVAKEPE